MIITSDKIMEFLDESISKTKKEMEKLEEENIHNDFPSFSVPNSLYSKNSHFKVLYAQWLALIQLKDRIEDAETTELENLYKESKYDSAK